MDGWQWGRSKKNPQIPQENALFQSGINYLIGIWGAAPVSAQRPLQVSQNRALRLTFYHVSTQLGQSSAMTIYES